MEMTMSGSHSSSRPSRRSVDHTGVGCSNTRVDHIEARLLDAIGKLTLELGGPGAAAPGAFSRRGFSETENPHVCLPFERLRTAIPLRD
jgi:hypothetical protein